MFKEIVERLPKEPYDYSTINPKKYRIWTCGDEILCKSEAIADAIADLLEAMGYEDVTTGYYDPEEDAKHNEVDRLTGWHWVSV
jgi:hypothetical protein